MKNPTVKADEWCSAASAVKKIKKHAESLDVSISRLIVMSGVYPMTYYRWANGETQLARVKTVEKILAVTPKEVEA